MKNIETNSNVGNVFDSLYQTLEQRKKDFESGKIGPTESYTAKLLDKGIDSILKKISEEVTELILGVKNNDEKNIIYELSDVIYFLNVLMVYAGIKPCQIANELARRFGTSGIEEKQNRKENEKNVSKISDLQFQIIQKMPEYYKYFINDIDNFLTGVININDLKIIFRDLLINMEIASSPATIYEIEEAEIEIINMLKLFGEEFDRNKIYKKNGQA